jgi:RadC-like JAB domain
MEKVTPEARPGQGSDPSCAPSGAMETLAPAEAASSLLQDRGSPQLQPLPHLKLKPKVNQSPQDSRLRSFSRRAARAMRPFLQGMPDPELWMVGYDGSCRMVGVQRLVPGAQGQPCASPLSVLGWTVEMGARAIVLVQNRPGPVRLATAVELLPTLKLAAAATLLGVTVADHILINGDGRPTMLGERSVLAEARALATHLQTELEALASTQPAFGIRARTPDDTPPDSTG